MTAVYLITATLIVSFAWGMRGDLIGGEEGATLPGAFVGLSFSMLFGEIFGFYNIYFMVALGMVGMFIGGAETYAETLGLCFWGDGFKPKPEALGRGLAGVAIKGAAWFGICAATLGIGVIGVTTYTYENYEFVILIVAMMLARLIGDLIFNRPIDAKNGKFPKIYFSKTRPEEWGGMILMLVTMFVFALLHKDYFTCILTGCGVLGGSVGWIIAQFFHSITKSRLKNGKYILGKLSEKNAVDAWKIMEFTLGAFGSLSIAIGFAIQRNTLSKIFMAYYSSSVVKVRQDVVPVYIYAGIICLYALANLFKYKSKKRLQIAELIGRPILCYLPMVLLFMGYLQVARILALVVLPWYALEEMCFVQLKNNCKKNVKALTVVLYAVFSLLMFTALTDYPMNALQSFDVKLRTIYLLYFVTVSILYVVCALVSNIAKVEYNNGRKFKAKDAPTLITVYSFYIFCIIVGAVLMIAFG